MNHQIFSVLQPALFQFDSNGSSYLRSKFDAAAAGNLARRDSSASVAELESIVVRPIDPMLLVYEERLESIRILLRWIRSVHRSIVRMFAA